MKKYTNLNKVYFTGARYEYRGGTQNVQTNELMIAIKEEKELKQ